MNTPMLITPPFRVADYAPLPATPSARRGGRTYFIIHWPSRSSPSPLSALLDRFSNNMYRARAGHLGVVVVDPDAIKRTGEVEPLPVEVDEVLPSVREGERELRAKVVGDARVDGSKIR